MKPESFTSLQYHWFSNGELSLCLVIKDTDSSQTELSCAVLTQSIALQARTELPTDIEIIPTRDAITLVAQNRHSLCQSKDVIEDILNHSPDKLSQLDSTNHQIPICYDQRLGTDLGELASHLKMTTEEIISKHLNASYRLDMLGFLPGFFYLSGLDPQLKISRKSTPSVRVPAGSVAIAESMSGIYSLSSPGGWWVIGRTPLRLFDYQQPSPIAIKPLDQINFVSISYQQWLESSND